MVRRATIGFHTEDKQVIRFDKCPQCNGTGGTVDMKETCPWCDGHGHLEVNGFREAIDAFKQALRDEYHEHTAYYNVVLLVSLAIAATTMLLGL